MVIQFEFGFDFSGMLLLSFEGKDGSYFSVPGLK